MRLACSLATLCVCTAAFVEPPAAGRVAATRAAARASAAPVMVLEQMKEAAKELEMQAASVIVQEKVAKKLAAAQEKYNIPDKYMAIMSGFFTSYMTEVYRSGKDMDEYEVVLTTLFKKVLETAQEPYEFAPFHEAIREPFDYYKMGNEFAMGVVNVDTSLILGKENIEDIKKKTAAGDNVVLFANHQSEADPQIFSCLLDPVFPGFAEETIFVAGDRVTTDLLAQPFSMGRNLLCIFSKKHIENPPELKSKKSRHNRNVMKKMGDLFKEGGKVIWVAPSGGRDRKDDDGNYAVAPFDGKSVEMFRLMADKAGKETHFYPLSMLTYNVCPPPESVGGAVGEQRTVKWSPAGLHFGDPIDLKAFMQACVVDDFPEGCDPTAERDAMREKLTQAIHAEVAGNYAGLTKALKDSL